MIGENDKLYIPEWIKELSLEELRKEKEKILQEIENQRRMRLTKYNRKITKEQYDRAMTNKGFITDDDMNDIFFPSEMFGYGIYDARAIERNNEYYVTFTLGSSCD